MSNQFQFVSTIQFVSVNGQVASSHPRTACACQFTLVIGQAASSHPRTACTCQFVFIGQVASSHPRTACACQFTLVIGQAASSHPRTACTCQFVFIGQVASSHPRTACTYPFDIRRAASSCPRTACAFYFVSCQPSNQFVSKNGLCFLYFLLAKRPAQIQEQLAPFVVNIPGQVASSHPRTACTCQICYRVSQWVLLSVILLMSTNPAMDTTCSVVCYSVNVYQSRNGYDMLCCLLFC